eukprot:847972-Karenia_brevis.AAC.1
MQDMQGKTDLRMSAIADKTGSHDEELAELKRELREVKQLQMAQGKCITTVSDAINAEAESRNVPDPAYTRAPIRTLLRLNVSEEVSRTAVQPVVDQWLDGTYKPEQYKLDGPLVGTAWSLLFLAPPETASLMASKSRSLLRRPDGSWEVLKVGEQILYIKFDNPPNVRKVASATSKLAQALRTTHPSKSFV